MPRKSEDLAVFAAPAVFVVFWASGFVGNTIVWRGRKYYLLPDGRFELIPAPQIRS